jgi:hypothetical protein
MRLLSRLQAVWFRSGVIPPAGQSQQYWTDPYSLFWIEAILMNFAELKRWQVADVVLALLCWAAVGRVFASLLGVCAGYCDWCIGIVRGSVVEAAMACWTFI